MLGIFKCQDLQPTYSGLVESTIKKMQNNQVENSKLDSSLEVEFTGNYFLICKKLLFAVKYCIFEIHIKILRRHLIFLMALWEIVFFQTY